MATTPVLWTHISLLTISRKCDYLTNFSKVWEHIVLFNRNHTLSICFHCLIISNMKFIVKPDFPITYMLSSSSISYQCIITFCHKILNNESLIIIRTIIFHINRTNSIRFTVSLCGSILATLEEFKLLLLLIYHFIWFWKPVFWLFSKLDLALRATGSLFLTESSIVLL